MSRLLEQIVREVQGLSDEERRQLASMLHRTNDGQTATDPEHSFEEGLVAEGFLTIPAPTESNGVALGPPLQARGGALSDMLIAERR